MTRWLALLRGVNLGKYNKVPMADLRAKLEDAGFSKVRTYIQSGNIIVETDLDDRDTISARISDVIQTEYGVTSLAAMLTRDELARSIERDPFLAPDADPKAHRIMVLTDEPDPDRVQSLDPNRSPGHAFAVEGRIIWLYIPQFSTTKLTNDYFDRRLGIVSTLRNRSTMEALLKLMDERV